ncbi:hypothetical protein DMENIID0001_112810 [Sergentomyia squamirostris]
MIICKIFPYIFLLVISVKCDETLELLQNLQDQIQNLTFRLEKLERGAGNENSINLTDIDGVLNNEGMTPVVSFNGTSIDLSIDSENRENQNKSSHGPGDCKLPNVDVNLRIYSYKDNTEYLTGDFIPNTGLVRYECTSGFSIVGEDSSFCVNGFFLNKFPVCTRASSCSIEQLFDPVTMNVSCHDATNLWAIPCSAQVPAGNFVSVWCREGFTRNSGIDTETAICLTSGLWSIAVEPCLPECGVAANYSEDSLLLVPWISAIYRVTERICQGSIISSKTIISVAHCFWSSNFKQFEDKSLFSVAVDRQQFFSILDISISPNFQDLSDGIFLSDMAVILLDQSIVYGPIIRPICVDFGDLPRPQGTLMSTMVGRVPIWDEYGFLRVINLLSIDHSICHANSPPSFQSFVTLDKFCTGPIGFHRDGVCQENTGAGFATFDATRQRYFLVGILSVGPLWSDICDNEYYTTFADISLTTREFLQSFL